jgi:endonuclease G
MARMSLSNIIRHLLFRLVPPGIWLLTSVGLGAWYVYEVRVARPLMTWMGLPHAEAAWDGPNTWTRVLRNRGFLVGYSDWRGNPLWVIYRLARPNADAPHHQRPSRFATDWRGLNRVGHDDYTGSGYDRGHLAPNHAIAVLYGREAQLETFLMTNVTPQRPNLDHKLWRRLERMELDHFTRPDGKAWVVTGPIFEPPTRRLSGGWRVEIPSAFYKIVVAPDSRKAIAFVVPQTVEGGEPLEHYLVSVDSIERKTGLDFFRELDDVTETRMEAEIDPDFWRLGEVTRSAGRHAPAQDLDGDRNPEVPRVARKR